jgi:hypothetical protein
MATVIDPKFKWTRVLNAAEDWRGAIELVLCCLISRNWDRNVIENALPILKHGTLAGS